MKILVAFVLLLANVTAIGSEPNRVHTGTVVEVSADQMMLDQAKAGTVMIGFVTDSNAIADLTKIDVGDEIRAVFGSTQGPNGTPINKLVSIRVCTRSDEQCASDRIRQKAEADEYEKKRAISQKQHESCNISMRKTLASDTRYVSKNSVPVSESYLAQYNALTGAARTCATKFVEEHDAAVLDACLLHSCGENIGGGCWHLAGRGTTSSAIQNAINKCSD